MKRLFLLILLSILMLLSCTNHFIEDDEQRATVAAKFEQRRDSSKNKAYFSIFDSVRMSRQELGAMKFLYAYMPLSDLYNYPADLYLRSIKATLLLKNTMKWCKNMPQEIFNHFVMPLRVDNESLDSARHTLFSMIYPRIKDMDMYQAALEVNHWCYEKVTYQSSDSRTSSPLATMNNAIGRDGEEAVFVVAALRSVGIPARLICTPRWAHIDGRRSWVEVWIDGKWHYMGACEPEPQLDMVWFSQSAKRGLLMHTKVFGNYKGNEPLLSQNANYTEINVTENYAPVNIRKVVAIDQSGRTISDCDISFSIYNYGEFYQVFKKRTDFDGKVEIIAGRGDMFVLATKGNRFGYSIIKGFNKVETKIVLNRFIGEPFTDSFDIVPPIEAAESEKPTAQQVAQNCMRLEQGKTIRENYIATFLRSDEATMLAKENGYPADNIIDYISRSRGNWHEIVDFIKNAPKDKKDLTIQLLSTLSDKDLRDVKSVDLIDHLNFSPIPLYKNMYVEYVLAPRIANEDITQYKELLQASFGEAFVHSAKKDIKVLVKWIDDNISVNDTTNNYLVPIEPMGVYKSLEADTHSRNIFFVAVCRSFGIAAQINPVTYAAQYYHKGSWITINFKYDRNHTYATGRLELRYRGNATLSDPIYDNNFAISKIDHRGYKTLNFRNKKGSKGSVSYKSQFTNGISIEEGYYVLTSAHRTLSGRVLVNVCFFNIRRDKTSVVEMTIREEEK